MNESVIEFGPGDRLVGILTRPTVTAAPEPPGVTVVITNAGIIHRVGANRLHVRLARYLAGHGYSCLRYDLPGIGDSEPIGTGPIAQENLAATRAAMDRLQAMGVAERFVMIGLCSGADHSFMAAVTEPRIVGALIIDPTVAFPTPRHRRIVTLRRLARGFRPSVIWRVLTGRKKLTRAGADGSEATKQLGLPREPEPAMFDTMRSQATSALTALVARRVQLFYFVTGHSNEAFSYRRQLEDAFPDVPGLASVLTVERRPAADHTFSRESERQNLEAQLLRWLGTVVTATLATRV